MRLSEKKLHKLIKESIRKLLKEEEMDEFEYGDSVDIGPHRHQQAIFYKGEFVGFLTYTEKNPFVFTETYSIPDVEEGLSEPDRYQHLRWVELKYFNNYDEAFNYVKQNFEDVVYLANNGCWD